MDSSTITVVGWNGDFNNVDNLKCAIIKSFTITHKEPEWNYNTMNGTVMNIPDEYNDIYEEFLNHMFEAFKIEMITDNYYTASIIVNNKVYFIDFLSNYLDYNSHHPYNAIGKMYLLRERLDKLLPNLVYPPQNMEWIKTENMNYTKNFNQFVSSEVQLKLIELLRNKVY